jgi:autotransporter-associated beta strand protein
MIFNGNAPFIGADTGSVLNLTGGMNGSGTGLTLTGGGTINFTTTALNAATAPITLGRPTASNTGVVNIAVASPTYVGAITVSRGTLNVGVVGVGSVGGTGAITVNGNALLNIDDTTTAVANRMGGRAVTLNNAGNLTYTANGGSASSETFGALTSGWGANKITLNNAGGSNATLTFASLAANAVSGGSILNFNSAQTFNGTTNRLVFTTSPTLTNGIIQRAVVADGAGVNFATNTGAATPITAFSAYTNSDGTATGSDLTFTNVNGGTAYGINASNVAGVFSTVPTYRVTGDTAALSNPGLNFRGINALKIDGVGTDVTFATSGGTQLALGSGNLLATGTGQTIGSAALVGTNSAPAIFLGTISNTNTPAVATAPAFASAEGGLLVDSSADLTVNAALYNTANVTKGLGGALTFNTKQFFNTGINYFTINGGMVTLNGGENTLWQGAQGSAALGSSVAVGPGATLNLNGNSQMVGDLRSPNGTAFAGSGGTIINGVAGTATFISVNSPAAWGGNISSGTGAIFYNKSGAGTQTFYSDNTYTGGTLINGGVVAIQDEGRLSGTTSITINNAALNLTDAGTMANADRINNAATISMRGGNLSLTGRDATNSSETVGVLTLAGAQNNLTATVGANGTVRSAVLEIGNLTQTNYATVLLGGASGQMGNAGRIIIANGSTLLVNGIIPWATDGGTFASYVNPTAGNAAGGLAVLTQPGYQGYDASVFTLGSGTTTQNLRLGSASFAVPDVNIGSAGTYNANAIAFNTSANNQTLSFTDNADTLNLNSGGGQWLPHLRRHTEQWHSPALLQRQPRHRHHELQHREQREWRGHPLRLHAVQRNGRDV